MSGFVYEPLPWKKHLGYRVQLDRCRHAVHEREGVGFRQCARKPKVFKAVPGHKNKLGFCAAHAKEYK